MKIDYSQKITNAIRKLLLFGCSFIFAYPFLFLFFYVLFKITFPSTPNKERAIELLRWMSYTDLPASSEMIYSKHYQDILSSNVCFVFEYQEGYYDVHTSKYNYLNQNKNHENKDFIYDFDKNMVENEGCSKFASKFGEDKAKLFMEYDYRHKPVGSGRGLKIFVNDKDNLVMFEGYLYD